MIFKIKYFKFKNIILTYNMWISSDIYLKQIYNCFKRFYVLVELAICKADVYFLRSFDSRFRWLQPFPLKNCHLVDLFFSCQSCTVARLLLSFLFFYFHLLAWLSLWWRNSPLPRYICFKMFFCPLILLFHWFEKFEGKKRSWNRFSDSLEEIYIKNQKIQDSEAYFRLPEVFN